MSLTNEDRSQCRINARNTEFWAELSRLTLERMSDDPVRSIALDHMLVESAIGIPLKMRTSLEKALADAANAGTIFRADFSRRGGKARKLDALQELVETIVSDKPKITVGQLLQQLRRDPGIGVITSIEDSDDVLAGQRRKIHYMNYGERPKTASVAGLKDRLARAKAKIGSH